LNLEQSSFLRKGFRCSPAVSPGQSWTIGLALAALMTVSSCA